MVSGTGTTRRRVYSFAHSTLLRAGVDKGVAFSILTTCARLVLGPLTPLLIASYFSAELQGYYYTFNSVLALQVFVELGLATVVTQFASHEWSSLKIDERGDVVGRAENLRRLISLGRLAFSWYGLGGCLAAVGLGSAGLSFFSRAENDFGVEWAAPWVAISLVSGAGLVLTPAWALLEGCGQVPRVYAFRLFQTVLTTSATVCAILLGAQLWVVATTATVGLTSSVVFLTWRYRRFFWTFLAPIREPSVSWRREIWPMQWRIALSWLSGYFVFSFFTPVLFSYQGPVVAGQMGMTWALTSALGAVSSAWVTAKSPGFGTLIARKDYGALDRIHWRITVVSLVVATLGAVLIWLVVYALNLFGHPLAQRLLSPLPTGLLLVATILLVATYPQSAYLRAHKREPLMIPSIVCGALIGLSTLLLGSRFGAMGVAAGYLCVVALFALPVNTLIWHRCKVSWHPTPFTDSGVEVLSNG